MNSNKVAILLQRTKYWLLFVALIFVDQASKLVAHLQGRVTLNPGISFGLLFQLSPSVLTFFLVAVLVIAAYVWLWYMPRQKWAAMWFFAGGVSNLVDRVLVGAVRDWLDVPLLGNKNNLADWFILVGVVMVVVHFMQEAPRITEEHVRE